MNFIHVTECVWSAGWALFERKDKEIEKWVEEKLLAILREKAGQVAKGLGVSAHKRNLKKRESINNCIRYLKTNKVYLQYDKALSSGYPIATGVIRCMSSFDQRQI